MRTLRVRIRPTAAFGSSLMSDTLWGQVCLAIKEMRGNSRLESLLGSRIGGSSAPAGPAETSPSGEAGSSGSHGSPFAVFSDGFPADRLPKPRLAPFRVADWDYDEIKASKKQRLVPADVLMDERNGISGPKLVARMRARSSEGQTARLASVGQVRVRNSINRQTGRVQDGALFASREVFFDSDLDIYAAFDGGRIDQEELLEVIGYVGEVGYGRDRSVGLGKFEILDVMENPPALEPVPGANAFVSLSRGVPDDGCQLHYGATSTKFGRHGGEWALSGNPFKNPVVLYDAGSTFRTDHIRSTYGRALEDVSLNPGRHLHAAWLLPAFLRLEES